MLGLRRRPALDRDAQAGAIDDAQYQRALVGRRALDQLHDGRDLIGQREAKVQLGRATALDVIRRRRDDLDG